MGGWVGLVWVDGYGRDAHQVWVLGGERAVHRMSTVLFIEPAKGMNE